MNRLIGWSEVAIGLAHKTLAVLLAALLCLSGMPVMALAYEGDAAVESSEIVDPLPEAETQSGEAVRSGDADIATDADIPHDRSATNSLGDEVDRAADEGQSHDGIDPELEQPCESAGDSGGEAMETSSEDAAMQIGFVYIDKSIVDSAGAQDVVVALSDESAQLTDATLEYGAEGAQYVEAATMLDRNAARFQLKNLPPGDYRLAGLSYQIAGEEEWSRLDFGGEGYEFIVSSPKEPEVQTCALSTEGDDVEAMVEDAVAGAIEEGNSNISLLSLSGNARSLSPRVSSDSGIVVALDPGHGGSDPGAVANGLQEKSINLKIAQYCRAALQAHGVKVFMTRSDDSYVGLSERVQRAVAAGASIFVSIHINSATPAASGCEVFIPNDSSYNHDTHVVGKELGEKIIAQLTKLGLPNRGVKTKDSESGAKDPDGNLADYYSVINQSRKNNIPGIIVEHAFITNSGEAVKLQSESFLKQLGEADARGILEALDVDSLYNDGKGYRYRQADGTDACDTWMTIDGRRYYFGSDGYAAVWNRQIDGDWYYFDGAGRMVTGWVVGNNDGLRLYFDPSTGKRTHGWKTLGAARYWFDPATGKAAVWNRQIDGDWYYFDGAGRMVTGLVRGVDDGLVRIYDKSTGVRLKGWVSLGGKRYYIDPATEKSVRWNQKIDGKWYYFNGNSEMVTGMVTGNNDGLKLYFDPNTGIRQTGWKTISGHKYYFDPATGKSSRWNRLIDGKWYYFNAASQMVTGWVKKHDENAWLYYWPDGTRASGTQVIGGYRYSFNKDGLTYTKPIIRSQAEQSMINKAQQYSSRTGYLILVNRSTHKVGVFVGSTGAWSLKYYWSCVTGAPATPTIVGSFYTTGSKRGSLSTDSRAKYCTQIKGGYFFHTILASESELGHSLSHGCIRLSYESARWIYSNVKAGTRVIIY